MLSEWLHPLVPSVGSNTLYGDDNDANDNDDDDDDDGDVVVDDDDVESGDALLLDYESNNPDTRARTEKPLRQKISTGS